MGEQVVEVRVASRAQGELRGSSRVVVAQVLRVAVLWQEQVADVNLDVARLIILDSVVPVDGSTAVAQLRGRDVVVRTC